MSEVISPHPTAEDIKESQSLLVKAESGDAQAQWELGFRYWWGQVDDSPLTLRQRFALERRWLLRSANQGLVPAQRSLAESYWIGAQLEVSESAKIASKAQSYFWYRMAADAGDSTAQAIIAEMLAKGEGVARNPVEAYARFRVASARCKVAQKNPRWFDKLVVTLSPVEIKEGDLIFEEILKAILKRKTE